MKSLTKAQLPAKAEWWKQRAEKAEARVKFLEERLKTFQWQVQASLEDYARRVMIAENALLEVLGPEKAREITRQVAERYEENTDGPT